MAAHTDFQWFRGEDILITFTQTPVVDITTWTLSCVIKPSLQAPAALTIAGTIISGAAGTYSVAVTAAQNTTTLVAGTYHYSVTRTNSGSVAELSEGAVLVKPSARLA